MSEVVCAPGCDSFLLGVCPRVCPEVCVEVCLGVCPALCPCVSLASGVHVTRRADIVLSSRVFDLPRAGGVPRHRLYLINLVR